MEDEKLSQRFIKHGWLTPAEVYNPLIHNFGKTMAQRNIQYDHSGKDIGRFYDAASMKRMKKEIKYAECPICFEQMADNINCRVCDNGHKFHNKCRPEQQTIILQCPLCYNKRISECGGDLFDTFSGGKNQKRKTYRKKKNRKRRTNRKKV